MSRLVADESLLADAYVQLLASSTTSRYLRKAAEFARAVAEHSTESLVGRARVLLSAVGVTEARTVDEAELALVLVGLADRADEADARGLVEDVANNNSAALSWLAAMARWLRDRRPATDNEIAALERELEAALSDHLRLDAAQLDEDEDARLTNPKAA